MSTYAIGDIQGCFIELEKLLAHIHFNPQSDTLWFTGDLVNRGPQSLETLRFIKALGNKHITVLGNHDLHLLAIAYGKRQQQAGDTFDAVLTATDRDELLDWLRTRPLLHHDQAKNFVMTHAGLAPMWSLQQARELANEVESKLQSHPADFFEHMFGNQPDQWSDQLTGMDRLRLITNFFTRMRFCYPDGRLDLSYKGEIAGKPDNLIPWFDVPNRANAHENIIFGHWAALDGKTNTNNIFALDTGCVWGNCLTALRLEDLTRFNVRCAKPV